MRSPMTKLQAIDYAIKVRIDGEGVEEAVFPAAEYERIIQRLEALRAEGYSDELHGDTRSFKRGWSYYRAKVIKDAAFIVRALDVSLCPDARMTDEGLDWAGISLPRPAGAVVVAGPVWRHVHTWSRAHYFFGPTDLAEAASWIGSELRKQSPRVVGPWTLPAEVWFDVRSLGVDAKVRLLPCTLAGADYLFQRTNSARQEHDIAGVLIQVTGAEQVCFQS